MNKDIPDPKKRFSSRVDNYIKYRPGYPPEIIDFIQTALEIHPDKIIADIGSGTGIFTELLLKNGYTVYAVEPNDEMRHAADKMLNSYFNFKSINGSAENTGLDSGSVDLITSAQAFHWFDIKKAKGEFKRILKRNGLVLLLWNTRMNDATHFMNAYEEFLIRNSIDYTKVSHTNIDESRLKSFFSSGYRFNEFSNKQVFDFEGLKGRVLSSSYIPDERQSSYGAMLHALEELFHKFNRKGFVELIYKTEIYSGSL